MKIYSQNKTLFVLALMLSILLGCDQEDNSSPNKSTQNSHNHSDRVFELGCAFTTLHNGSISLLEQSDSIITQELIKIMNLEGLKDGFFQMEATNDLSFAKASTIKSSVSNVPVRYILYSKNLVAKCKAILGKDWIWGIRLILAHEIAHHKFDDSFRSIKRDSLSAELNHQIELDADRYAGGILALLGGTLEQSQKLFLNLNLSESNTHPKLSERLLAVEEGWKKGRASIYCAPNSLGKFKVSNYPGGVNLAFRNRVLTDSELKKINSGNFRFRLEIDKDSRIGFLNSGKEVFLLEESGKFFKISTFIGENRVDGYIINRYKGKSTITKIE